MGRKNTHTHTHKKGNKPETAKVECFGIKGTDTEESAWTGVVKGKQNGEQVRAPRNGAKIKQLHSSKQACNEEGWCPQQECCESGVEPTEEKTEVKGAMQIPPTQISLLVYSVEEQHTARGIPVPSLLWSLSLTARLKCQKVFTVPVISSCTSCPNQCPNDQEKCHRGHFWTCFGCCWSN